MSDASTVDGLIVALGSELEPVKPLRPPLWRAALWIGAVALTASVMAAFADLPGIAHRLSGAPDMWLAVLGSTLTAMLGAIAVFQLSVTGPQLALGPAAAAEPRCLDRRQRARMHAHLGPPRDEFGLDGRDRCVLHLHRGCVDPALGADGGHGPAGLSAAAGADSDRCRSDGRGRRCTLLNFFHPYDASAEDLAVHLAAVALVIGCNQIWAGRPIAHARSGWESGRRPPN